jgi:hypothetical protein
MCNIGLDRSSIFWAKMCRTWWSSLVLGCSERETNVANE